MLTANPLLDADSAYIARSLFMGGPLEDIHRLSVADLVKERVVEAAFTTPVAEPLAFLSGEQGDRMLFKSPVVGAGTVRMGWMPTLPVSAFSCQLTSPGSHKYRVTRHAWVGGAATSQVSPSGMACTADAFSKTLLALGAAVANRANHVEGIEIAGPEMYKLNMDTGVVGGQTRFVKLVETLVGALNKKDDAPLVVGVPSIESAHIVLHIDVGAGVPLYDHEKVFSKGGLRSLDPDTDDVQGDMLQLMEGHFGMKHNVFQQVCHEAKAQNLMSSKSMPVHRNANLTTCGSRYTGTMAKDTTFTRFAMGAKRCDEGEPAHYELARQNLDVMIEAVQAARSKLSSATFDSRIKVRFGGATHVTAQQAKKMQAYNIGADVHLTSDLATGALNWETRVGDKALFVHAGGMNRRSHAPRDMLMSADTAEAFAQHGVLKLLLAGVDVTLGTNGAGMMHSSHEQDFDITDGLLREYEEVGRAANHRMTSPYFEAGAAGLTRTQAEWGEIYQIFKDKGPRGDLAAQILKNQAAQRSWLEAR